MTNIITLTIPNDDHIALRAFGKALEEMALAHGAEPVEETLVRARVGEEEIEYLTRDAVAARLRVATEELQQAAPRMMQELRIDGTAEIHGKRKEPEVDTTAQQVESLTTNVVDREVYFNNPASPVRAAATDSTGTPWDERIHSTSKALNADGTWRLRRKPKDMDEAEWADYINETLYEIKPATTSAGKDIDKLISEIDTAGTHGEGLGGIEPPVTPPGDDFHTDAGVVTEQTVAGIPPLPVPPPTNDWKSEVTHPENGDLCSVCMKPQFSSPSGVTCENGHGGAPAYEKPVSPPVVVAPPVTEWDFPRLMTFLTERHGKIDVATVNTLLAQDGMSSVQELNAHPDKIGPFVARVKAHLGE
ncbi:MAG: hypothetical protein [Bacteriophage sp.]|nr:MAG: hypothetical protein [Bacteriophage sp.]